MLQVSDADATRRAVLARTFALVCLLSALSSIGQAAVLTGVVRDEAFQAPVPSVLVQIPSLGLSVVAKDDGSFGFRDIRAGTYTLTAYRLGYDTTFVTGLALLASDSLHTTILLKSHPVKGRDIVVFHEGDFMESREDVGRITLDVQAMRFAPGSLDDVSRSVSRLPAVTPLYDVLNVYSVRGGSPFENGFFLDGIELPDISHLPNQGSTGGAVGLLKLDFLERAQLHTGGMGARFGRRMSSVFEMEWRRPRRDCLHTEVNLGVAGLDLAAEGPFSQRVSVMVSARHSYLDRLLDNTSIPVSPRFNDYQGKISIQLDARHELGVIGVLGVDNFDVGRVEARKAGYGAYFGEWDAMPSVVGLTWKAAWTDRLRTRTTLARTVTSYDYHFLNLGTGDEVYANRSTEAAMTLRHDAQWTWRDRSDLAFGIEWRRFHNGIRNVYENAVDRYDRSVHDYYAIESHSDENLPSAYVETTAPLWRAFSVTGGLNLWYFSRSDRAHLEPRGRLRWSPDPAVSVELASGVYNQPLPENLVAQADAHRSLPDPQAIHVVLGAAWHISDGIRAQVEMYTKHYTRMPMDPTLPWVYVLDEILARDVFRYALHEQLVADGEAFSQGVEFLFSRMSDYGFYGDVGLSFSDAKYRFLDGWWWERAIDVERGISLDLGYRSHNGWTFTWAYRAVGGLQLTPYNYWKSRESEFGVLDAYRPNTLDLPNLNWMDIRVERQFPLGAGSLAVYAGVWNVTDESAITTYVWSPDLNQVVYDNQLGQTPIMGLIYRR